MTLPASGPISFNNINVELGVSGTTQASLGQTSYRTLAGVPSGAISMSNFYGKSNAFAASIASNQTNFNLRTWALANGWNGSVAATITINSGVYIYSTSTANAALTIDGSWPGGVTVVNNGYIMGQGGNGGNITGANTWANGTSGGPAVSLGVSCTITNNSYIGGGGGGGACVNQTGGGGGAGGGIGGYGWNGNTGSTATSAGGAVGSSGTSGAFFNVNAFSRAAAGGGGGRIFAGATTARASSPSAGGPGGQAGGGGGAATSSSNAASGGAGGGGGVAGGNGTVSGSGTGASAGGGGGGWGASGGLSNQSGAVRGTAAAAGKAIALNGFTATTNGSGTTYGAVA